MTDSNSFQKWAIRTLFDAGIRGMVICAGNWICINGEPLMSEDGVRRYIRSHR